MSISRNYKRPNLGTEANQRSHVRSGPARGLSVPRTRGLALSPLGPSPSRSAHMAFLCYAFAALVAFLPEASWAQGTSGGGINLVGNGSFESVNFTPWVWNTCSILIIAEPQHVADGNNCAVVCGRIYQDVGVVPGMTYQLRFAFGGDDGAQDNRAPLTVSWGMQTLAAIPVDPVSTQAPNWRYLTFDVLATAGTMRLGFSTLPAQAFPLLDNVSLTAVPEPNALTLFALAILVEFAKCRWVKDAPQECS